MRHSRLSRSLTRASQSAGAARGFDPAAVRRIGSGAIARGFLPLVLIALLACVGTAVPSAARDLPVGSESGLPVPRFVSLKANRVNVRAGPTMNHQVIWVFTRAGLPVEITAEFENWRRVRDWEGAEGWVYHSLLSGRRSAFVAKRKGSAKLVPLYDSADAESTVKAKLEPGVLGLVRGCDGTHCRIIGDAFDGFIAQERLWGVYPGETID